MRPICCICLRWILSIVWGSTLAYSMRYQKTCQPLPTVSLLSRQIQVYLSSKQLHYRYVNGKLVTTNGTFHFRLNLKWSPIFKTVFLAETLLSLGLLLICSLRACACLGAVRGRSAWLDFCVMSPTTIKSLFYIILFFFHRYLQHVFKVPKRPLIQF